MQTHELKYPPNWKMLSLHAKLHKIQNVEDECNDLEDQVEDLKKRINRQLREVKQEK